MSEVLLDSTIDESFVDYLKNYCEVSFYKDFTFPMYIARMKKRFIIKGLIGQNKMSVVFNREEFETNTNTYIKLIENFTLS